MNAVPATATCTYGTLVEHRDYRVVYPGVNASYVARNALWARGQVHSTVGRRPLYSETDIRPLPSTDGACTSTRAAITEKVNRAYL